MKNKVNNKNNENDILNKKRHSLAHILAMAVKMFYPQAKLGIGPIIENGFYYDFDFPENVKITPQDLQKIEKEMKKIIKRNMKFERKMISRKEAEELLKDEPYKLELLREIEGDKISFYKSGDFIDLCKGGHIENTNQIDPESFKLHKIAGAYWRGDEKNKMLTRIYGIAFNTKKELDEYFEKLKEAEKRDHTRLAKDMDLYHIDYLCGPGLPLWHPKGAILRKTIEKYLTDLNLSYGYLPVITPHIAQTDLWKQSGHLDFYRENMYPVMKLDEKEYIAKPMSCPLHILIYKSHIRSYKDLPIRYFENATVYRYEKSGVLHGLTRVRMVTQDDGHIFVNEENLGKEIERILRQIKTVLKDFKIKDYYVTLSTKPEKYIGSDKIWEKAENVLLWAIKRGKFNYEIAKGEGAFYGPKIDLHIKDALGRLWQCSTLQVDFNLPEKLNVEYIDKKGNRKKVIMLHRALIGAFERFIGVLLEYHKGVLPLWVAPVQLWIVPVGSKHKKYAKEVYKKAKELGIKAELKDEKGTIGKKIRNSIVEKIPYVAVIGDKELKNRSVRIREITKGDLGEVKVKKFLDDILSKIENKK